MHSQKSNAMSNILFLAQQQADTLNQLHVLTNSIFFPIPPWSVSLAFSDVRTSPVLRLELYHPYWQWHVLCEGIPQFVFSGKGIGQDSPLQNEPDLNNNLLSQNVFSPHFL